MEIKSEQPVSHTANVAKTTHAVHVQSDTKITEQTHTKNTDDVKHSAEAIAKKQLNQSILQASMDVSLSAGNQPMTLLFKTAIEGINKVLEEQFGPNAIQQAHDEGLDVSPQATADRIVQLSTAFFDKYQANHPELSTEKALDSFTKLIGSGIDKGFKEARSILEGLNVLKEGNIASNIDATYDLVQKGLKAFVDNYQTPKPEKPNASAQVAE